MPSERNKKKAVHLLIGKYQPQVINIAQALDDAEREAVKPLMEELELAWGLLANAYGGDWNMASKASGWKDAAERWRDRYHAILDERRVGEIPDLEAGLEDGGDDAE